MTEVIDEVVLHYRAPALIGRLKAALPQGQCLTPQQLAPLDQFHTLGITATEKLGKLAGVTADTLVLDVGAGIGGPARFLAATHGCQVTGIDLSTSFVEAARYLTERTGQNEKVWFWDGNALDLPFDAGSFDVVVLQHVAMNIGDRPRLYREIRRVLKAGGKFGTFDALSSGGEPHYPLPWARTPDTSFLLTVHATREAVCDAGFRTLEWQDDTEEAKTWFGRLRASGPPPSPNLGLVMGPDFAQLAANLARNLMEDRLRIVTAVFEAA